MSGETSLYARLLGIEDEFLFAMSGDDAMLESFCSTWAALQQDIQSAQIAETLPREVAELAFSVSTRISIISEVFEELEETVEQLSDELDQELDRLFESSLSSEGHSSSDDYIGVSRIAPYIHGAYTWLLDNLHNPYPPKEFKNKLACESGSSMKLIDGWFVDVRKRMGWAKIKKDLFQNKRKPLVQAATCVLVDGGMVSDVFARELAQMVATAKKMYSHKVRLGCISDQSSELSSPESEVSKNCLVLSSPRSCLERSAPPENKILDRCDSNRRKRPRTEQDLIDQTTSRPNKRNRLDVVPTHGDETLSSPSSPLVINQSTVLSKQTYQSLRHEDPASITYSSPKAGSHNTTDAITLSMETPKTATLPRLTCTDASKNLFPFEPPRFTNCDRSIMSDGINFDHTLPNSGAFEGCLYHGQPSALNDDSFIISSGQSDNPVQALCADPALFPILLDETFGDSQSKTLLQPYALESIPPPTTDDIHRVGFDLESLLDHDTSTFPVQLPDSLSGNPLFSDFLSEADLDSSAPSLQDSKAEKMTQLAQLKIFNSHIQDRIKLLECQIALSA